jgi:hypothetical protein
MMSLLFLLLTACGGDADDSAAACPLGNRVVLVDLDGALTPSPDDLDDLFLEPPEDPALRDGAVDLLRGYRERGVRVVAMTVQGDGLVLGDGTPMKDAVQDWLTRARVPVTVDDLLLGEDFGANGAALERTFKTEALALAQERGEVLWAYGDTPLDAEVLAEVPQAFIVGDNLPVDQAFVAHAGAHLPTVSSDCE